MYCEFQSPVSKWTSQAQMLQNQPNMAFTSLVPGFSRRRRKSVPKRCRILVARAGYPGAVRVGVLHGV